MKKFVLISILLLTIISLFLSGKFFLSPTEGKEPNKIALLIGISDYDRERDQKLDWHNLNCTKDVEAMEKTLEEKFGFKDILVITDEKSTHDGIIKAFREQLIEKAEPGDVVVFHYSGHGQQIPDDNGDEIDGKDECLVPYDYGVTKAPSPEEIKDNQRIRDDELEGLLAELSEKMQGRGDIMVILDSCHSGTGTKGGLAIMRGRPWDEEIDGPEPTGSASKGDEDNESLVTKETSLDNIMIISACKTHESAYEDPETNMGVLTENLIKVFEKAEPDTTYRDLYQTLCLMVDRDDFQQNPGMEGEGDKILLNGTAKEKEPYLAVKPVIIKDELLLELPAGELHGITAGSVFAVYPLVGEEKLIANAEITIVDMAKSYAKPDKTLTEEELLNTKAVEISHNYDSSLKIYIEDKGDWSKALEGLQEMNITGATQDNYDIKIYFNQEKSQVIMTRKDGTEITAIDATSESLAENVEEAILNEWRNKFIIGLNNESFDLEIRFLKVGVNEDPSKPEDRPAILSFTGEAEEVKSDEHNQLVVEKGDWVTMELKNNSDTSLYITIFAIDAENNYGPIFPHPNKNYKDIIDDGYNCIPPDNTWYRIPFKAPENYWKKYTWKVGAPFGTEHIKVIATTDHVDFSYLVDQRNKNTGKGDLLQNYKTPKGDIHPLAMLLVNIHDGGSKGLIDPVSTESWGTADLRYTSRE